MVSGKKIEKIQKQAEEVLLSGGKVKISDEGIPCFIAVDGEDAYRDGEDPGERETITAIVKHHLEDKYLMLRWLKVDWHTFITGGIEDGQTAEEAARAEVLEETGYKNLKLLKKLSRTDAKFYHSPKQTNRTAHFQNFYFELENDERAEVDESEKHKHKVLWVEKDKVKDLLAADGMRYVWVEII